MFFFLFGIGIKILFILTILFYLAFFVSVYAWSEVKATFLVVPFIYTFQFFAIGFLVVITISLGAELLLAG